MRTASEICIAADQVQDIDELVTLKDEVRSNLKQYTLVDLKFMWEHLTKCARALGRKQAQVLIQFFLH